jgi:outer membrane immunogenic protein
MVLIRPAVIFRFNRPGRTKLKRFHAFIFLTASLPTLAVAADLPTAPSAELRQELPRWTGFYLGFNRGFGGGIIDNGVVAYPLASSAGVLGQSSNRSSGFIAGGQIGYNYQFANNFILGVESDLQWSDIKSSQQSVRLSGQAQLTSNIDAVSGLNWFGTTRARLGYALGRVAPYVTGGVAYGKVQNQGSPLLGSNSLVLGTTSQTNVGFALGAGADIAISDNLSAKSEYLYVSMPSASGQVNGVMIPSAAPLYGALGSGSFGSHIIRGGMNYRYTGLGGKDYIGEYRPLLDGDIAGFLTALPSRDWSGFYIGVNGGYGGDVFKQYGNLAGSSATNGPITLSTYASSRTGGFIAGGHAGYNFQFYKHFVVGVETDGQWSGVAGLNQAAVTEAGLGSVLLSQQSRLDWFGTSRLRAGFARGDSLSYATAGVAYGNVGISEYDVSGGLFTNSSSAVRAGWVLGSGTEYAILPNVSLRAEYLYMSMAGLNSSAVGATSNGDGFLAGTVSTGRVTNNIMRAGLTWSFNAPADVVTRQGAFKP